MTPELPKRYGMRRPSSSPVVPPIVRVFEDETTLSDHVADRILRLLEERRRARLPLVLGLAAGASPRGVYRALRDRHEKGASFDPCVTFNLDEYYPMGTDAEESFFRQLEPVIDGLGVRRNNRHRLRGDIPPSEVIAHCDAYEARIREAGGIDFQILGVGGNGHIAFNEPGTPPESRTRLVELHGQTRRDAAGAFGTLSRVPRKGLTMGLGTILEAREIVLLALGSGKAEIVRRIIEEPPSPQVPASYLTRHPGAQILLDRPAAQGLKAGSLS